MPFLLYNKLAVGYRRSIILVWGIDSLGSAFCFRSETGKLGFKFDN
jgi:hypothetical protein